MENTTCTKQQNVILQGKVGWQRINSLVNMEVDILICGAISRQMELGLRAENIKVISQICGPVDQVISAYINNQLSNRNFIMPGCRRNRRRFGSRGRKRFIQNGRMGNWPG